ncbi:MAG: Ldh family oxidoreductase [Chloroflexi bacterium]|nr:Ldh family oxidoreductase [Chloroflexota bacterium]
MNEVRIDAATLERFTAALFEGMGLAPADAATEAHVLVWANLRGIDSHGVLRVPQYQASVDAGGMNPRAVYRIERETAATLLIEADYAFGPVVTTYAMQQAIAKARQAGVGWAVIRNTTHQGAMGYYALMAAEADMMGLAIVCNPPNMAPAGARAAGVHNSPIAIAAPALRRPPLVMDMATSVAAFGKINLAVDKGVPIPPGWALDAEGQPTTDAQAAKTLLPAGGYKGYGLSLMFECLSSVMAGNALLARSLHGETVRRGTQNSVVAAIDIAAFTDVETFKRDIDATIAGLKGLPTVDGVAEVLVPGEPELATLAEREAHGIPLPAGTVHNLQAAAERLGVPLPAALKAT